MNSKKPNNLIQKAIDTAVKYHRGQYRKGYDFKMPYVTHAMATAEILKRYTDDVEIISAGILHDTIEDTNYTRSQLIKDFGKRTSKIVLCVTENISLKKKLGGLKSWKIRKQGYLDNIRRAPIECVMVSCADKIHNLSTLSEQHKALGKRIWKKYNAHPQEHLWFFTELGKVYKKKLKNGISAEFERVFKSARKYFKD